MPCKLFRLLICFLKLDFLQPGLRVPAMLLLGVFLGLGLLLAQVGRVPSYLSDDPKTCMNCHVMTDAYISWEHSSHANQAVCNDCHVPHTSIPRAYAFKAQDGLRHATIFTLRQEPESIKLSAGAIPVVQENCLRCHEDRLTAISACREQPGTLRCWDCHRDVPHGRVHSLSASPGVFRPELPPVVGK